MRLAQHGIYGRLRGTQPFRTNLSADASPLDNGATRAQITDLSIVGNGTKTVRISLSGMSELVELSVAGVEELDIPEQVDLPRLGTLKVDTRDALETFLKKVRAPRLWKVILGGDVSVGDAALEKWKALPIRTIVLRYGLGERSAQLVSHSQAWEVITANAMLHTAHILATLLRMSNVKKITAYIDLLDLTPGDLEVIGTAAAESNVRVLGLQNVVTQPPQTAEERNARFNGLLTAILRAKSLMYLRIAMGMADFQREFTFNAETMAAMVAHRWLRIVDVPIRSVDADFVAALKAKRMAFLYRDAAFDDFRENYNWYRRLPQFRDQMMAIHDFRPSPRTPPVTSFLRRDGDHAIMSRVAGFLGVAANLDENMFVTWPQPARGGGGGGDGDGGAAA